MYFGSTFHYHMLNKYNHLTRYIWSQIHKRLKTQLQIYDNDPEL